MSDQVRYASLDSDTFAEGGGILNDVDGTIVKARFAMFDYQGKSDPAPAIMFDIQAADGGDLHEQAWSLGSTQDWRPSEDGRFILCINTNKDKPVLNKNSNGAILLHSMKEKGVPVSLLAGDISRLEGMKCHWVQIPDTRNLSKGKKTGKDGKQYDKTILVVSGVVALPAGASAASSAAGSVATPSSAAGSSVDSVVGDAIAILTGMVLEAGGELAKKDLPGKAMNDATIKAHAKKTEIRQLLFKDDFLKANFNFENGIIAMKA